MNYWVLGIYLAVVSLVSIVLVVYDKIVAQSNNKTKHKKRIPEATLMCLAVLGGSAAMYITMQLVRHKTRHLKFMLGIPAIFLVQLAIIIGLHVLVFAK